MGQSGFSLSGRIGWWFLPVKEKDFYIFPNEFLFNAKVSRKSGKISRHLRKYEFFYGDRMGYLAQLLYGTLLRRVTEFK
jgi:hypothetical protein